MKNEIYEYLINYGFSKENLDRFEELNEDMYFVSLDKVKENINFFEGKELNNKEIISLANINPSICNNIFFIFSIISIGINSKIFKSKSIHLPSI